MLDHIIHYRSFSKLNYNILVSKFLITTKYNFQKSLYIPTKSYHKQKISKS